MNTLNLSQVKRIHWLLLCLLLAGAAWLCKPQTRVTARTAAQTSATKPPFTVRSYGGKCLEVGLPRTILEQTMVRTYPVFIADCKGTAAQQVRVEELTDRPGHLVILRAGNGVIGKKVDVVATPHATAAGQEENNSAEPASFAAQSFYQHPGSDAARSPAVHRCGRTDLCARWRQHHPGGGAQPGG